jgi:hypothetical protein
MQDKRVGELRARTVSSGQMRQRLFLMKRQDRGLLRVMGTRYLKVSKSKNHLDKPHG